MTIEKVYKYVLKISLVSTLIFCTVHAQNSNKKSQGNFFPTNLVSIGYFNRSVMGGDVPRPPRPLIWTARQKARVGSMMNYERLLFHTQSIYSLTLGVNVSGWYGSSDSIETTSLFLKNRFWIYHNSFITPYIVHSVAGLTYISKNRFGKAALGKQFLFQDLLGLGLAFGQNKNTFSEIAFYHFSNGGIFHPNNGFDVPFIVSFGVAF